MHALVATHILFVRCSRETESRAKRSWKAIGAACWITIIVPCICAPYMHKVKDVFYFYHLPSKRRLLLLIIVAKVKDVLYGVKSGFPPFPRKAFRGRILLSVLQKIEPTKTRPLIWRGWWSWRLEKLLKSNKWIWNAKSSIDPCLGAPNVTNHQKMCVSHPHQDGV